jgi:hypothetical protein
MSKRGKSTSKAWSAGLNQRIFVKIPPTWEPEDQKRAQEYHQSALLDMLCEALGVAPGDYKTALLRIAELYVPAFKEPLQRGAKPGRRAMNSEKLLIAVEEKKRADPTVKSGAEALRRVHPNLKGSKAQGKLKTKRNQLAEARRSRGSAARPSE